MLKIGSAVHTAHGPGTVTDTETTRGRTQYKVAGQGFSVWVDETKIAALGDVDESNSTTLPYDYTPQHPTEMYAEEQTITPDHDIDYDERMAPTNSVTGESESIDRPGPSRELFAYSDQTNFQSDFADDLQTGEPLDEQQHRFIQYLTRFDNMAENAKKSAQQLDASIRMAAPGSMNHYIQWAQQAGLQPDQEAAADLYGQTHGVDGYSILDKLKGQKGAQRIVAGEDCEYCGKPGHGWQSHPEAVREVEAYDRERHREEFPFGDYQPSEYDDFSGGEHFGSRTAAGGWGDTDVDGASFSSAPAAKPGSFDHYLDYSRRNGLHPGESMTADRYSREHGVPLQNTSGFATQFNNGRQKGQGMRPAPTGYQMHPRFTGSIHEAYPGKHRKAPEPEMYLPGEVEVWDSEDWDAAHPHPVFTDPRDQARYEEYLEKLEPEFGDRRLDSFEPIYASYRPAGLSDKFIDLPQHTAAADDIVAQFRNDPFGTIQRTAYLIESATGLDPRVGQYMDLVEADPMVRQAAWSDVHNKAMRLRREGAVQVKDMAPNRIYASVTGDNGVYNVYVYKGASLTGSNSIDQWHCGCEWGKWAFRRKKTFVGRLCSHGLAAYMTMQSAHQTGKPRQQKLPKRKKPTRSLPVVSPSSRSRHSQKLAYDDHLLGPDGKLSYEMFLKVHNIAPDHPKAKYWYQQEINAKPEVAQSEFSNAESYWASLPKPSASEREEMHPESAYSRFLSRGGSVLSDYKSWVDSDNNGVVDVPGADAYLSQLEDAPSSDDAKAVYDYVYDNFSERPERNYDVDSYTFDPDKVWDGGNGEDNATLRSQSAPLRLSPDLYRVPEGEGPTSIDVEKDTRKTTGPDQIQARRVAKVDKKWAQDHADQDDEANPIVHFSMRKEALTYTADEGLLKKLRDLSAKPASEDFGNMAERNHEVAEIVSELRDRGYDASLFVAMRKEAVDPQAFMDSGTRRETKGVDGKSEFYTDGQYDPFGGIDLGNALNSSMLDTRTDGGTPGNTQTQTVNKTTPAPAAPAAPANSGGGGGAASGGGGSDWSPNTDKSAIGEGKYTIQQGDTYADLAQRAGWGDDYQGFANSTGYQANDPDKIFAGDTIDVKAKGDSGTTPSTTPSDPGLDTSAPPSSPSTPVPGGPAPTSGTPGVPPAPGPAPSSGVSDYAPNPGGPYSTSFAQPPTPTGPQPGMSISDPAMASPGLSSPNMAYQGSRYFFAEDDDELKKPGTPIDGSDQKIESGEAGSSPASGPTAVAPTNPQPYTTTPEPPGPKSTGVDPLPQITTDDFNNRPPAPQSEPSDGSKKVLEESQPQNAISTSGGGLDGFSDFTNSVVPILEGVGGALMPAVTGLATGIGNAIGSGLSGLFTAGVAADDDDSALSGMDEDSTIVDPAFAGSGPSRKDFFSTSEEWHDHHDYLDLLDEPESDLISYKTQPKQAAHEWNEKTIREWVKRHDPNFRDDEEKKINFIREDEDSDDDIVRQFQANIANTALGSGAGGGGYSDDAIAQAAQGFLRTAGRVYSLAEQQELMDESHPQGARNLPGLDLRGTHYLEG